MNGVVVLTATKVSDPSVSETKEITLAGTYKWVPGRNVLTGTLDPFTFENMTREQALLTFDDHATWSIIDNPKINDRDNSAKVVKLSGNQFPRIFMKQSFDQPVEVTRLWRIQYNFFGNFINANRLMLNDLNSIAKGFGQATGNKGGNVTDWDW